MIWENGQSHEIIFSLWFGKQYKWVFHQCVNGWNSLSVFNRVYSMRYSTTGGYFSDYITSSAHETLLTVIKNQYKSLGSVRFIFLKKLILLFILDAFNLSKVRIKTFIMLQNIYISNKCYYFELSVHL